MTSRRLSLLFAVIFLFQLFLGVSLPTTGKCLWHPQNFQHKSSAISHSPLNDYIAPSFYKSYCNDHGCHEEKIMAICLWILDRYWIVIFCLLLQSTFNSDSFQQLGRDIGLCSSVFSYSPINWVGVTLRSRPPTPVKYDFARLLRD